MAKGSGFGVTYLLTLALGLFFVAVPAILDFTRGNVPYKLWFMGVGAVLMVIGAVGTYSALSD